MIQGNAARCAVELAVLDAYGRALGEPLTKRHRTGRPGPVRVPPEVQYSGVITNPRRLKKRLVPLIYRLAGFAQVKLKVGIAGQDDVKRTTIDPPLARLEDRPAHRRERGVVAGRGRRAHPRTGAVRHHERRATGAARGRRVPGRGPQAGQDADHARRVAVRRGRRRAGGARTAGATCSTCGCRSAAGSSRRLRLAQLAKRHGLGYQLGCQVGETAILSAAGRHFATSVDGLRYLEGCYDRHLVWERLSQEDITFPPRRAGTGARRLRHSASRSTRPACDWVTRAEGDAAWAEARHLPRLRRLLASTTAAIAPPGAPRARLVFLHGIRSHGGWYARSCRRVRRRRVRRLLPRPPRLRAEHRPPRRRAELPPAARRRGRVRAGTSAPSGRGCRCSSCGISWGGKLAVGLPYRKPGLVDGLVLLCPGLAPKVAPPLPRRLRIALARRFRPDKLFPIPLNDPELFTASPEWQKFIDADPHGLRRRDGAVPVQQLLARHLPEARREARDRADAADARRTRPHHRQRADAGRSSRGSRARRPVIEYPGAHHTLEFEPPDHPWIGDVARWVEARIG